MLKFSLAPAAPNQETGRPWYDTKRGIAECLTSLQGLQFMLNARHEAGYQREERMNEFYILGRYGLDTCGNCSKVQEKLPEKVLAGIPEILTRDEFWAFIREKLGEKSMLSFAMNGGDLPLPGLKCAHCGKTWDIADCHDTVVWHKIEVFPLTDFVGATLGDVKDDYAHRDDAIYRMQPDILIRSDRFIDRSPKYPSPKEDWEKCIVKNENGWVSEHGGIKDDYVIQPGDEGFFNVWRYFHSACNREHLHQEKEYEFREIFEKAGFTSIKMTAKPNGYCPCDHCAPWFDVATEFGTITIGWRKRVINIDWNAMQEALRKRKGFAELKLVSLFASEDVTKEDGFIHAWGWDKAQEYLAKIRQKVAR